MADIIERNATCARQLLECAAEIERLRAALEFYRDPFAWKKMHDPEDDVRVPDFYNETCFGDTAEAALNEQIAEEK